MTVKEWSDRSQAMCSWWSTWNIQNSWSSSRVEITFKFEVTVWQVCDLWNKIQLCNTEPYFQAVLCTVHVIENWSVVSCYVWHKLSVGWKSLWHISPGRLIKPVQIEVANNDSVLFHRWVITLNPRKMRQQLWHSLTEVCQISVWSPVYAGHR